MYGIEKSAIALRAQEIVELNGFAGMLQLLLTSCQVRCSDSVLPLLALQIG